jgi:hypothetical protein
MNNYVWDILANIQHINDDVYIGGSLSLILQNVIPYRNPKDIDLIFLNKNHIYDVLEIDNDFKRSKINKRCHYGGVLFESFYNPTAEYISYNHNGYVLKLSPAEEVFKWKLKNKHPKHQADLIYYNPI